MLKKSLRSKAENGEFNIARGDQTHKAIRGVLKSMFETKTLVRVKWNFPFCVALLLYWTVFFVLSSLFRTVLSVAPFYVLRGYDGYNALLLLSTVYVVLNDHQ